LIFVTVGSNTPFDRLIQAVDHWAAEHPDVTVKAQIGAAAYRPKHMAWQEFIEPVAFLEAVRAADLMVSHAGMGVILTALDARVPLLVMPRQAGRYETRNDHQFATVQKLANRNLFHLAMDEQELSEKLDRWRDLTPAVAPISNAPLASLQTAIVEFIESH
jgi:exopolysaccharide biosynthesis glucuronosyltransferase PssE